MVRGRHSKSQGRTPGISSAGIGAPSTAEVPKKSLHNHRKLSGVRAKPPSRLRAHTLKGAGTRERKCRAPLTMGWIDLESVQMKEVE